MYFPFRMMMQYTECTANHRYKNKAEVYIEQKAKYIHSFTCRKGTFFSIKRIHD